jgi:hypothetical protein
MRTTPPPLRLRSIIHLRTAPVYRLLSFALTSHNITALEAPPTSNRY